MDARKKKPRLRARDRGEVVLITFETTPELKELVEECRAREDRTFRAVMERAIKQYAAKESI